MSPSAVAASASPVSADGVGVAQDGAAALVSPASADGVGVAQGGVAQGGGGAVAAFVSRVSVDGGGVVLGGDGAGAASAWLGFRSASAAGDGFPLAGAQRGFGSAEGTSVCGVHRRLDMCDRGRGRSDGCSRQDDPNAEPDAMTGTRHPRVTEPRASPRQRGSPAPGGRGLPPAIAGACHRSARSSCPRQGPCVGRDRPSRRGHFPKGMRRQPISPASQQDRQHGTTQDRPERRRRAP